MSVHDLVAVLQEQLAVQKEQLEKQKEHFEQQLAAQEDSYGKQQERFEQQLAAQADSHEKQTKALLEAFEKRQPATPVTTHGWPSFTPFDSTAELWMDYSNRFNTWFEGEVGAGLLDKSVRSGVQASTKPRRAADPSS
jgi:hypothetical protein